jgi:chorismate dehydratase
MPLRVGHISYINCAPFFHFLREAGFRGEIVSGVPSQLNRKLAAAEIDLSPSSSFEYALHWRDYCLLPGHSISSTGSVQSVLFFTSDPLTALTDTTIAVTGESATSVHLLQVLLREFYGCSEVHCMVPEGSVEGVIDAGGNALLIGDRALRTSCSTDHRCYDLGELWFEKTGLPFVFALWIVRREIADKFPQELAAFVQQLSASRRRAEANLPALAAECDGPDWLGEEGLVRYWEQMSYDFTEDHRRGLELFFSLCQKYNLLESLPELHFL